MILLLSKQFYETSTDEVVLWLSHFKKSFLRLNGEDFQSMVIDLQIDQNIYLNSKKVNLDYSSIWNRRWSDYMFVDNLKIKENFESRKYLLGNEITIKDFFYKKLIGVKYIINDFFCSDVNKLQVLDIAVKFGLNVPNYLVTNSKIKMLEFYNKNSKKVITKDIKNPFRLNAKKYTLTTYTEIITEQRLQTIPATFYPSFFQVLIKKEYEVRVFYLDKEIYSMAIFSQNDKKTKVDFRHYNINTPNRCVPMNLPIELKIKIQKIMCNLKINCGSIDLIKSTDGLFYFLEINPFGQFGMISHPCNYQLEKKIAQKLSKNEKN